MFHVSKPPPFARRVSGWTRVFMIRKGGDAAHHTATSLFVCASAVTDAVVKSQIRVMCATASAGDTGHTTARSGSVQSSHLVRREYTNERPGEHRSRSWRLGRRV